MLFSEIIAQDAVKLSLIKTIKEGRISHAQLFLGPEGSGNLALAVAYATYIACGNKQETDACGKCPSCQKMAKLIHPDLHFVYPIAANKDKPVSASYIETWRQGFLENPYLSIADWHKMTDLDNKQTLIAVKESEEIMRKVSMTAYEAPYNFVVIWMPGKMNTDAANKLLKVLEEPPGKSLFLLVEHNHEDLLPTIISRLQNVKVPALTDQAISSALQQKFDCTAEEADRVAHMCAGNFNQAMDLVRDAEDTRDMELSFISWSRLCYAQDVAGLVDWADEVAGWGRERQKLFLLYALRMIRENLLMNLGIENLIRMDEDERQFSNKFHAFIHPNNGKRLLDIFSKAYAEIERNANPRILFLDLSLEYGQTLKVKPAGAEAETVS